MQAPAGPRSSPRSASGPTADTAELTVSAPRRERVDAPLSVCAHHLESLDADLLASGRRNGNGVLPAFWLAANTGMRRGELLGLRWGDLDVSPVAARGR